jgi:hypothetical protein
MEFIISVIIFIVIFVFYLHLISQYKKSEDLEVYEMDYLSNTQLQEVCAIKQPILFDFSKQSNELITNINQHVFEKEVEYDIKLKDSNDYFVSTPNTHEPTTPISPQKNQSTLPPPTVDYIVLPFESAMNLLKTDKKSHFFIENNEDFIDETGIRTMYEVIDENLKPYFTVQTKYDFIMGSKNTQTPLRYHTYYRQFYIVTNGRIHVKMTPWKSSKYVHPIKDYEAYEFKSPINVWKPQNQYLHDMDKIKFLEFDVHQGYVLYVPPYWWYSFKFSHENMTSVSAFTYNSPMNIVANSVDWAKYFIQQQNITKKPSRTSVPEEPPSKTPPIDEDVPRREIINNMNPITNPYNETVIPLVNPGTFMKK